MIWETAGHPVRAGLKVWQPYEYLTWPVQKALLRAAAVAVQLAAGGRITARGVLGAAIRPAPQGRVYDGDRPSPYRNVWRDLAYAARHTMNRARTDRAAARQLLDLATTNCRTRDRCKLEILILQRLGIPTDFLPDVAELDRLFPAGQPVTVAGRR